MELIIKILLVIIGIRIFFKMIAPWLLVKFAQRMMRKMGANQPFNPNNPFQSFGQQPNHHQPNTDDEGFTEYEEIK